MRQAIIALAFILVLAACTSPQDAREAQSAIPDTCSKPEIREVRGSSMEPLFKTGENITILMDHYSCHNVSRDDIVVYEFSGNIDPIIKRVRGMPGDNWTIEENRDGTYAIILNGEALRNAAGTPYAIPAGRSGMLKLYTKDYPAIPHEVYLILGEDPQGSYDSTSFGLVGKQGIVAKVQR